MNEMRLDPIVEKWLSDGPNEGPQHGLNRALAATQKVAQRPGWTFPRWWLPSPVADLVLRVPRVVALSAILVLTLALVIALAVAFGSRNAPLVLAPTENIIAFAEAGAIYVANSDGSNRRNLNVGVAEASSPVFSPDGSRIAFLGGRSLHIAAVDGSSPRLVDASHGLAIVSGDIPNYSWSSDGTRIAFAAMDGGVARIFVVDRDGNNVRAITDRSLQSDLPSWGPVASLGASEADWIAYRVTDASRSEMSFERVRPDGTSLERVSAVIGPGSHLGKLSWSPPDADSGSVGTSYSMNVGFETETKAVIDLFFGHMIELSSHGLGGYPDAPVPWSPDSRYLVFINGAGSVIVADADRTSDQYNGQLRDLGSLFDCWVDWSPDSRFLYGGSPNDCQGVVVVPVASPSAPMTLTAATGMASWRPMPQ